MNTNARRGIEPVAMVRAGFAARIVLAVVLIAGCNGGGSSPTENRPPTVPPPPVFPSITGTYSSASFWTWTASGNGQTKTLSCNGQIAILSQEKSAVAGTFTIGSPCPMASGTVNG